MGLDYIRAQTGKPWRKRWNGRLDRLKSSFSDDRPKRARRKIDSCIRSFSISSVLA